MDNIVNTKIFNILLLVTVLGEFILPWVLKYFYRGYNSKTMVMSALGSPESPVRAIYNIWLVWLGVFLFIAGYVFFMEAKVISSVLAVLLWVSIGVFAVGAGILSGIFSVNESKDVVTTASKIHGAGAAIGFMFLLLFPLFSALIAFKMGDKLQGVICIIAFVLAFVTFGCFIMGDKEELQKTIFAYEGLWERLTLFFMYIPFIYKAVVNLFVVTV